MLSLSCWGSSCSPLQWRNIRDEPAQGMLHLNAGLRNGAIFASISLLAPWCCGNAAVWDAITHSAPPKGLAKVSPLLSSQKNLPWKMGCGPYPADNAVPFPQCQVTPICNCSGHLGPFSRTELACCLLRAGLSLEQTEPPARCPCHSPAALGTTGSSELCREGSIPSLLLCCALELAGAAGALCIAGGYGATASIMYSPGAGRVAACSFLQPSSRPERRTAA